MISFRNLSVLLVAVILPVCGIYRGLASDHSDAPISNGLVRQDANITDLHAFVVDRMGQRDLVLALSTNPAIPKTASDYVFPSDVVYEIYIDVDAPVDPTDPHADGGTVLDPDRIREEVVYRIRFRDDGSMTLQTLAHGWLNAGREVVQVYSGLRDDPFIRVPRDGRNVASIVLELSLSPLIVRQDTLLIWATTKVEQFDGPFQDMVGRALRSMFPEQAVMNGMPPRHHLRLAGLRPDVLIFDTSRPAAFPNGRALEDDVVYELCIMAGECRVFNQEAPTARPRSNDTPFLTDFPYLAEPHLAP